MRYDQVNAMLLNEFLKEHKAFLEEQRKGLEQAASIAALNATVAEQQKGIKVLATQLKEQASQIQKVSDRLEHLKPTKKDLMISKIISGAACLAELTSNPKSFYNSPDLHGGVPDLAPEIKSV